MAFDVTSGLAVSFFAFSGRFGSGCVLRTASVSDSVPRSGRCWGTHMRLPVALFAIVACIQLFTQPSQAETRVALVCTENLSSGVVVVKSAQDGARTDHTGSLNRARNRRILVQGSMRSDAIVIVGVGFQDPTQMHLVQDNDVIHTLTPDRSDQPFGKAIQQGEAGAVGLSRMLMARNRRVATLP
jgi:hypothetical protein